MQSQVRPLGILDRAAKRKRPIRGALFFYLEFDVGLAPMAH